MVSDGVAWNVIPTKAHIGPEMPRPLSPPAFLEHGALTTFPIHQMGLEMQ